RRKFSRRIFLVPCGKYPVIFSRNGVIFYQSIIPGSAFHTSEFNIAQVSPYKPDASGKKKLFTLCKIDKEIRKIYALIMPFHQVFVRYQYVQIAVTINIQLTGYNPPGA